MSGGIWNEGEILRMVYNCLIKCQVCGSITRVRLQVGLQEQHPIVIVCGKCGTSLHGNVNIGQDTPKLQFGFENANILQDDEAADYVVECSGEFPTAKQYDGTEVGDIITPFLRNQMRMDNGGGYEQFRHSLDALTTTAKKWKYYKRVLDLSQNNNKSFLLQEIKIIFPENMFPCRNEFEILRAIHMIEVNGFISPLRKDIIDDLSISSSVLKLNYKQICELINFINSHDGYSLKNLQSSIYKMLNEFICIYPYLLPAFATQFCAEGSINFDVEGTSTSSFESVKQFYIDAYETLGNLIILPVALNNIKYRNDFSKLECIEEKEITLDDFIRLTKANRFHYCSSKEIYTDYLKVKVNTKMRNAIGHNDIGYDTIKQQITYIPNPKDRSKKETSYLLEFEIEAIHLFQAILVISEYLYRIMEIDLINQGNVPIKQNIPNTVLMKIGRNDKCPCGSGLKYKYCHGK